MKEIMQQTFCRITGYQKSLLAVLGLLVVSFLALTLPTWKAQAEYDDDNGRHQGNLTTLAGTWQVEVPEAEGSFISYETFTRDGGSVEVNRPGTFSTSIGTWKRVGPRKFLATIYKQLFKIVEVSGEHTAQYDGLIKVRRLFTLSSNGNELTGVATIDVFDAAGNRLASVPTTGIQGTRLMPEPPDL